jgi:hypothetical protein
MKKFIVVFLCVAAWPLSSALAEETDLPVWAATQGENPDERDWESYALQAGMLGSQTNPVLCQGPPGEQEYLDRLRCSNGDAPAYERIGSFGDGPDGHVIDGYDVVCDENRATVFMDMYHEDHWETAPVGAFKMGLDD